MKHVTISVNKNRVELSIEPDATLVEVLREELGLKGTKIACDSGGCGACTVLVDGLPVYSCLFPAVHASNREVQTVEGLTSDAEPNLLQKALIKHGALQCGYCTPGMTMLAVSLLEQQTELTEAAIRYALSGNMCRCTGYSQIIDGILEAQETSRMAPNKKGKQFQERV